MILTGINHIGVTVSSIERTVEFYKDVFGGSVMFEFDLPGDRVRAMLGITDADARGKVCWVKLPGAALELFEFDPKQPAEKVAWNRPGCTHFALQVSGLEAWHAHLTARGVRVLGAPKPSGGRASFFYAADPDGNLIELIEMVDG
jgi:catechol 2,3-dioxygenase-like lactoylglutathione lyase family enzyme